MPLQLILILHVNHRLQYSEIYSKLILFIYNNINNNVNFLAKEFTLKRINTTTITISI